MQDLDSTGLIIGAEPQFFFDNSLLEEVQNITRTLHSPQKIDQNPLITRDKSWEHVPDFNSSDYQLWRDAEHVRLHCIYRDLNIDRAKMVGSRANTLHQP